MGAMQKLVVGTGTGGPLEDDSKALCQYGIGHGSSLILSERPERGKLKEVEHLAGPGLKSTMVKQNDIMLSVRKFMRSRVGGVMGKDLIESMPAWELGRPKEEKDLVEMPDTIDFFDYGLLADNNTFDASDFVRQRFGVLPRLAEHLGAEKNVSAYADKASKHLASLASVRRSSTRRISLSRNPGLGTPRPASQGRGPSYSSIKGMTPRGAFAL